MITGSISRAESSLYRRARYFPALLLAVVLLSVSFLPVAAQREADGMKGLEQYPQVYSFLKELMVEGRQELARRLLSEIELAKSRITPSRKGLVIVGRVVLDEGEADPRDVIAQMPIYEGGYFAGVVADMSRPVGFRLHGYTPTNLELSTVGVDQGRSTPEIVYVGLVHLYRLPEADTAALKGRLEMEDAPRFKDARLELRFIPDPINTPSNGYAPRPKWPEPVKVAVQSSGEFTAAGLSPAKYDLLLSVPGHVSRQRVVAFKRGETTDVGVIRLERPMVIELSYMLAQEDAFADSKIKTATIQGGDRWKATDDIYGWDVEFGQDQGGLDSTTATGRA